jgi:hypothetical protein
MKTILQVSYCAALMVFAYGCTNMPGTRGPRGEPSCSRRSPKPKINEGITGVVCFWQGDFMPGTYSRRARKGRVIEPVRRTIEIHAATTDRVVAAVDGPLWTSVPTPLIATVTSGDDGWFEVAVPPGTYSLFVRESGGLYANGTNGDGIVTAVEVTAGAVARTQLDITYRATY